MENKSSYRGSGTGVTQNLFQGFFKQTKQILQVYTYSSLTEHPECTHKELSSLVPGWNSTLYKTKTISVFRE